MLLLHICHQSARIAESNTKIVNRTVHGLENVYTEKFWQIEKNGTNMDLFRLYSECILGANLVQGSGVEKSPDIFHICWMEMEEQRVNLPGKALHPAWQEQLFLGNPVSNYHIRSVSSSVSTTDLMSHGVNGALLNSVATGSVAL